MKKERIKKPKKITFNEKIDSLINGFAVVLTYIIIGIILQFDNSFFGSSTAIIKISFIICGVLGFFTEIMKINAEHNIKGIESIFIGLMLFLGAYLAKNYISSMNIAGIWFTIFNVITIRYLVLFLLMLISIYGFFSGILELSYSMYLRYKESNRDEKNKKLFTNIILILSQLLGLILIAAQIYDILK
jgi:hypothetical protein